MQDIPEETGNLYGRLPKDEFIEPPAEQSSRTLDETDWAPGMGESDYFQIEEWVDHHSQWPLFITFEFKNGI